MTQSYYKISELMTISYYIYFSLAYCVVYSRAPLASFHELHHQVTYMHLDESKNLLITVGKDRIIKVL